MADHQQSGNAGKNLTKAAFSEIIPIWSKSSSHRQHIIVTILSNDILGQSTWSWSWAVSTISLHVAAFSWINILSFLFGPPSTSSALYSVNQISEIQIADKILGLDYSHFQRKAVAAFSWINILLPDLQQPPICLQTSFLNWSNRPSTNIYLDMIDQIHQYSMVGQICVVSCIFSGNWTT